MAHQMVVQVRQQMLLVLQEVNLYSRILFLGDMHLLKLLYLELRNLLGALITEAMENNSVLMLQLLG